jgi:hypothetical protein
MTAAVVDEDDLNVIEVWQAFGSIDLGHDAELLWVVPAAGPIERTIPYPRARHPAALPCRVGCW